MRNSSWSKFGQKDDLTQTQFIRKPVEFYELLYSTEHDIHKYFPVSENCIVTVTSKKEDFNERNADGNLILAAFTTYHARLRLLKMLTGLGTGRCIAIQTQ